MSYYKAMDKLQQKSMPIRTTPEVFRNLLLLGGGTHDSCEVEEKADSPGVRKKLLNSLLKLTIILSLIGWLMLPATLFAAPGGGGAAESPGLNIPPSPPSGTGAQSSPTNSASPTSSSPTGSGDRLSLKQLFGDANFDFSKVTLADIGRAALTLIDWGIALSGGVALIYLIWGGIQYLTAGPNEEQTKKAKATLTWAVIGLILIISSYALVKYFSERLATGQLIQ